MDDFFRKKREWSKYKDFILGYYLEPYVPKVNHLKKPILVIHCFAGRGEFWDGQPGSPLIISYIVRKWRDKGVPIRGIFIEAEPENYRPPMQQSSKNTELMPSLGSGLSTTTCPRSPSRPGRTRFSSTLILTASGG